MNTMEGGRQSFFTEWKPKIQQGPKRGKFPKGKPLQHSDEIGTSIETMPSLSKQLEGVTSCVIGLQYVWEYRSPSQSVPPLYQCKVCNVHQFQGHMLAHISGWKHALRYIKKEHADKLTFTEEEAMKDPTMKKTVKDVAAELASSEGRGQLKVILKEPADVPAFKGLLSSSVKRIQREESAAHMPPQGGYRSEGFGGYASLPPPRDYNLDHGQYYGMGHNAEDNYDGYEQGGLHGDYPPRYREMPVNPLKRPRVNEGGDLSNTLLDYLDTFKIENENDAQLVLKVTQKLTDILMEYRLGSVPKTPSMPTGYRAPPSSSYRAPPLSGYRAPPAPGYRPPPPKIPKFNEQYSEYQGPPRYSGPSSRF